jgi:hypothetical protein
MTVRVAALAVAVFALLACRTPRETLVDRRAELRKTLDQLYADFGGTEAKAENPEEKTGGVLGQVFTRVDRSYFERQCLAVGRGERPVELSAKLDAFLQDEKNANRCRKAAELQDEVDRLEGKVRAG